eukprot:s666_g6.t1
MNTFAVRLLAQHVFWHHFAAVLWTRAKAFRTLAATATLKPGPVQAHSMVAGGDNSSNQELYLLEDFCKSSRAMTASPPCTAWLTHGKKEHFS